MGIKTPCIAVYVGGASAHHPLRYGVEVNILEFLPKQDVYHFVRNGFYSYVAPEELYFPHLNTYNQPCFA